MTTALFHAAQTIEGETVGGKGKEVPIAPAQTVSPNTVSGSPRFASASKKQKTDRSRALRLEQNRQAARESRRRKKGMVEELQRSLMFFSKTNEQLKQQNELLQRQLLDAHAKLSSMGKPAPLLDAETAAAASTILKKEETNPRSDCMPVHPPAMDTSMLPGATMQAMASFQQAANTAMARATRNMNAPTVIVSNPKEATESKQV